MRHMLYTASPAVALSFTVDVYLRYLRYYDCLFLTMGKKKKKKDKSIVKTIADAIIADADPMLYIYKIINY